MEDSFTFARVIGVVAILEDKDATAMLEILEPVLDEVVVTRTTSPRAMSPATLGELATEIFGEDRVTVVDDLPDALDRAAGLADEGGVGGGVLATGSVTTAAEVRMLLGVSDVMSTVCAAWWSILPAGHPRPPTGRASWPAVGAVFGGAHSGSPGLLGPVDARRTAVMADRGRDSVLAWPWLQYVDGRWTLRRR